MSSSGIRTHNPNKREAADQRLRPHGHWDWHNNYCVIELFDWLLISEILSYILSSSFPFGLHSSYKYKLFNLISGVLIILNQLENILVNFANNLDYSHTEVMITNNCSSIQPIANIIYFMYMCYYYDFVGTV